jgi:hypothetical protein
MWQKREKKVKKINHSLDVSDAPWYSLLVQALLWERMFSCPGAGMRGFETAVKKVPGSCG